MIVKLHPDSLPPYYIDFARREFLSRASMADFPVDPPFVRVETEVAAGVDDSEWPTGRSVDRLLWAIGHSAFGGQLAPWLVPSVRYGLTGWPNFTEIEHTMFDLRMTAQLSNYPLTVTQLIEVSKTSPEAVHRVVNAFSLLGVLEEPTRLVVSPSVIASAPAQSADSTPKGGFLARLLNRWGR